MTLADRLRKALSGDPSGPLLEGDLPEKRATANVPAAVLIGITDRPEPGVILTVRREHMRTHAGQVAFPGGRIDPGASGARARARAAAVGLRRVLLRPGDGGSLLARVRARVSREARGGRGVTKEPIGYRILARRLARELARPDALRAAVSHDPGAFVHAVRLLRWWAEDASDEPKVVEMIKQSIEVARSSPASIARRGAHTAARGSSPCWRGSAMRTASSATRATWIAVVRREKSRSRSRLRRPWRESASL
jgi:hypothetical protein